MPNNPISYSLKDLPVPFKNDNNIAVAAGIAFRAYHAFILDLFYERGEI